VILHVVWQQDSPDMTRNIPQLELIHRVPGIMLNTYSGWMKQPGFIPCERSLPQVEAAVWTGWKEKLLSERMARKMIPICSSLTGNYFHWEEQLWWMLAGNFGMRVNAAAFESVARSIPFSLLARHRNQPVQLEALLFGQANLLETDFRESYPQMLKKEFHFLKKKYSLKKVFEKVHFLRMRPENFPTIRLSQLAGLYAKKANLFAWVLQCESLTAVRKLLQLPANDYWFYHYTFDRESPFREKIMGRGMGDNIIINSFIPLLFAYGNMHPDKSMLQKSLRWMQETGAEENETLSRWKQRGMKIRSAAESQAMLELYREYCLPRKCLDCDVGKFLLLPGKISRPNESS
jgi:hypothetical protein